MKPKEYVLGFAFTEDKSKVVLIEKQKPDWQKGKFNGVGGKVEEWIDRTETTRGHRETPYAAMRREFEEETGVLLEGWEHFATMMFRKDIMGGEAKVHCFRIFADEVKQCGTTEIEKVFILPIYEVLHNTEITIIKNLRILIPMALDQDFRFASLDIK